jgi:effector-binding domain-containing protein
MILWAFVSAVVVAVIAAAIAGPIMSRVDQPEYQVTSSEGSIEIREYGAMIAAEVEVKGERKVAINEGFRLIAAYIFGANEPNAKIAMTAPVQQQGKQSIAMTAPVTQQARDGVWTVRFIMPKRWTLETLPAPTDERIKLLPVPAKRMIAIRFSGTADDGLLAAKTAELRKYAADHKLSVTGEPLLTFYNPPWTLPFFRRNEIMMEFAGP